MLFICRAYYWLLCFGSDINLYSNSFNKNIALLAIGTIGTQKLLKYLENKGEGSGGNQPYESTR